MKRVITVGGLHGTGKSSVADAISKKFSLKRMAAGVIFRKMAKERNLTLEEFSRVAAGDEDIDKLIDLFRNDLHNLSDLLEYDFSNWLTEINYYT